MANSTLTISPSVIASAYASTPAAAVHHVYDRCYVDFAPVDFRWQISRSSAQNIAPTQDPYAGYARMRDVRVRTLGIPIRARLRVG